MKNKRSIKTYANTSKGLYKLVKQNIGDSYFMEVLYYHVRKALILKDFNLHDLDGFRISGKYLGYDVDVELDRSYDNVIRSLNLVLSLRAFMLNSDYLRYAYDNTLLFYHINQNYLTWDSHRVIMECIGDKDFASVYNFIVSYKNGQEIPDDFITSFKENTIDPGYQHLEEFCKILAARDEYHGKSVIKNLTYLCSDMEEFVVNKGVEYIGDTVFAYCENLKLIKFEGKVYFGNFPIIECKNLKRILVPTDFLEHYKEALPYYKHIITDNELEPIKSEQVQPPKVKKRVLKSSIDYSDIERVFDKKATSYKHFWFLSILKIYKETNNGAIPFKDILIMMVSSAWKYVYTIDCEFPQIDQLPKYLETVRERVGISRISSKKVVEKSILENYDALKLGSVLSPLLKNVPYRFLSPWIPFKDNDDVIAKSNKPNTSCLYSLHDDHITISPLWGDYLLDNYDKIKQFIENELRVYLKCDSVVKPMTITEFTKNCRELQSSYREKMGEPMGYGPGVSSPNKQINMLVNGEKTGKNFVNEFTFNYAKQRVKNLQAHETINSYRLFNNMLSSQPMAFNLFCPFMQMLVEGKAKAVTKIFKAIFPDKYIGEVTEVGLEYLHTDIKNYLNDCTAMDAIVRYKDTDGKPAFIAFETKYTDVLGENTSNKDRAQDKYHEWIKRIKMFKPETEKELLSGKKVITQIYRNFLLTECYGIVEKANRCYSVVLAPAQHPTTEKEVASLRNELLPEYQFKISAVSLEDFIEKMLKACPKEDKAPFLYFKERYIPNV